MSRAASRSCPRVRRRVVDLGQRVDRRVGERRICAGPVLDDVVAAEGEHAAVRELGRRRVPASDRHVGPAEVRPRDRVEDRRVGEALVRVDVAADEERPAVGELDVPGAEEIAPVGDRREDARRGIPEPFGVRPCVEPVEREDLPGRLERHVHRDERPRDGGAPLADLGRRGGDRGARAAEDDERGARPCTSQAQGAATRESIARVAGWCEPLRSAR